MRLRLPHRPRAVRRGQTLIEAAFTVPILILAFTACYQIWVDFQRVAVYSRTALTVAELVSKNGAWNAEMGATMLAMMGESIGIAEDEIYLHVVVLDAPGGAVSQSIGPSVDDDPSNPPAFPSAANTGWSSTLESVIEGETIEVDVWGFHEIGFLGNGWTTTLGRATAIAAPLDQ